MEWPCCPDIQGRPLDTALLLHRDYIASFCNHIYQNRAIGSDDLVPLQAVLALLQSTTSVGHILANRVDGLQNGFDTFAKIQQAIDSLHDQSRNLQNGRVMLGPYRVGREEDATMEVKEELQSGNLSESDLDSPRTRSSETQSLQSSSRPSNTPVAPQVKRTGKKVTIKIRDPATTSHLRQRSSQELAVRLRWDLGRLKVPIESISMLSCGDVRVITLRPSGARLMRNPRKWKPKAFGPGAWVEYPNT
ncbi:MAG: hypothetical protein Q9188_004523 [Gyalolechia gomerana]